VIEISVAVPAGKDGPAIALSHVQQAVEALALRKAGG